MFFSILLVVFYRDVACRIAVSLWDPIIFKKILYLIPFPKKIPIFVDLSIDRITCL
jgi:hypothetical protein